MTDQNESAQPTRGGSTGQISERAGDEAGAEMNQAGEAADGKAPVLQFLDPRAAASLVAVLTAHDRAVAEYADRPRMKRESGLTGPWVDPGLSTGQLLEISQVLLARLVSANDALLAWARETLPSMAGLADLYDDPSLVDVLRGLAVAAGLVPEA